MNGRSMRRTLAHAVLLAGAIGSLPAAHADEAKVRRTLAAVMPDSKIEAITPSPIKGLYEVFADGAIFYIDEDGRTVVVGDMIDVASKGNLTSARKEQLLAVPFAQLPLELAIKTVKGNGRRVFASFEDPNCGFCKQLHATLDSIDDYTLYTFLVPILGPDSEAKIRGIWCAQDRAVSLHGIFQGTVSQAAGTCEVPMERFIGLANRFRVQGTPTLIFQDGSRAGGALPLAQLEQRLSASLAAATSGASLAPR